MSLPRQTLLASSARTADATAQLDKGTYQSAIITVDCSADPALAAVTPTIQVRDGNGDWTSIWIAAAAVADVGTTTYLFSPGVLAADFNGTEAVSFGIPGTARLLMDHADTDSITYSVVIDRF